MIHGRWIGRGRSFGVVVRLVVRNLFRLRQFASQRPYVDAEQSRGLCAVAIGPE
jgi:hypothetical protein